MHQVKLLVICLALSAVVGGERHDREKQTRPAEEENFYEYSGVSPAEILQARGFQADEFYLTTSTGYRLRITRGRNPLIGDSGHLPNKSPVLFVHGAFSAANLFLLNSFGSEPKDFTQHINLKNTSLPELIEVLEDEPSTRSLPLLALNFGHEVWLLDRRGAPGSLELVRPGREPHHDGLPLDLDTQYWNYTLDDQARVDFPEVVDFVLEQSGQEKLSVVTHSLAGALVLMSESLYPERLGAKITSQVHWAPAYALGNQNPVLSFGISLILPILENYIGPVPPTPAKELLQNTLGFVCANPLAQNTICRLLLDMFFGYGGELEPALPELVQNLFEPIGSVEATQMAQMIAGRSIPPGEPKSVHHYDFGPERNKRAYGGSSTPPAYNLSCLASRSASMSFYLGATDRQVTDADMRTTLDQISPQGAYQYHKTGFPFSHEAFMFNNNTGKEAIIPTMQELETLAQ